jgi:hypothetical protein
MNILDYEKQTPGIALRLARLTTTVGLFLTWPIYKRFFTTLLFSIVILYVYWMLDKVVRIKKKTFSREVIDFIKL